jgi:hypothetical protein
MEPRETMTWRAILIVLGAAGFAGCQTRPQPIYHWGNYQALLYQDYSAPGKAGPEQQIETLKADLEKAKSANRPAPPGLHAHLGYLYAKFGRGDLATLEFQAEKTLFPESAVFIDALLARAVSPPKP